MSVRSIIIASFLAAGACAARGGRVRAERLSAARRREIARAAALARWRRG